MNCLIVLSAIIAIACAQKPGYLAAGSGQPELAYRFRTGDQSSTTPAILGNRIGGGAGTTPKIPIDARGDHELVERLFTWPEENRPYWLVNYEAIERFRNQQNSANSIRQVPTGQQGQQTNLQNRFSENRYNGNRNPGFNPNVDYDDFGNPIPDRRK